MRDRIQLTADGFTGFVQFEHLTDDDLRRMPRSPGVYVVVREDSRVPEFLEQSTGGWFKRKDPTVSVAELADRWSIGCTVVYVGQSKELRGRIKDLWRFGRGEPVGHWGGRYLWQIADSRGCAVAWKVCDSEGAAKRLEHDLVQEYKATYGRLPFANINEPRA